MLRSLYWLDTRDMIADGLTKGSVDRRALQKLANLSNWTTVHPVHRTPKVKRHITSDTSGITGCVWTETHHVGEEGETRQHGGHYDHRALGHT